MMNYDSLFTNSEDTLQKIEKMTVLKDGEGKFFFPITCTAGIYDMEGITLAERLQRLHELASERQLVLLNDSAYDKTSLLSYLKSILSDGNLSGDSLTYIRLSNAENLLFQNIAEADLITLKFHDTLFVYLIDTANNKRYHTTVNAENETLHWQEELTYSIDLPEEQKYATKEEMKHYVEEQRDSLTAIINTDIKTQIDALSTELSTIRFTLLQEIDTALKAQSEQNKNTYVSQTYFNTEFEKIKEELNNSLDITKLEKSMGNTENLETTDKSNLVNAINEVFQSGNNFKRNIRDTIIAKDSTIVIPEKPKLNDLTESIEKLKPSTYAEDATALAEDILTGKSAYTGEGFVEGTMPVNEFDSTTITPGTANIIIPKGYNRDDITVKGDPNLIPGNIMKDKSIFGILGTLAGSSGMQMASGYMNINTILPTTKNSTNQYFGCRVPININFNPKYIFAYLPSITVMSSTSSSATGGYGSGLANNITPLKIGRATSSSSNSMNITLVNISSSGFDIQIFANAGVASYIQVSCVQQNNWYAFG